MTIHFDPVPMRYADMPGYYVRAIVFGDNDRKVIGYGHSQHQNPIPYEEMKKAAKTDLVESLKFAAEVLRQIDSAEEGELP